MPEYMHKSAATYFAGQTEYYGIHGIRILYLLNQNTFPSMDTIKIFTSEANSDIYVIGYAFVEYVVNAYGEGARVHRRTFPASLAKTEDEFYNEWRQWLTNKYCK